MAPSAELLSDLKPKILDFPDWRINGAVNGKNGKNGSSHHGRPILIKVEKNGKNSWSLQEVTAATMADKNGYPAEHAPMLLPPMLQRQPEEAPSQGNEARTTPEPAKQLTRSKSAKQYTWLLLLQAHKVAGCLAWIGSGAMSILKHAKERFLSPYEQIEEEEEDELEGEAADAEGEERRVTTGRVAVGVLVALRVFAVLSFLLLAFEMVSHSSELELQFQLSNPAVHIWPFLTSLVSFHQDWATFRSKYIAPALQWFANACTYLFLIQSVDRIVLCLGCLWVKLTNYKPELKGSYEDDADPERPGESYPMVLVQMPMCNEREVYAQSIAASCHLEWPRNRFLIQVLDDSSDDETQQLIEAECARWAARGVPIKYRHRVNRKGYKAGNLDDGMKQPYVKEFEYVAIFDADFQPKPDFLMQTVPYFKDNPEVALVQARWSFVNKDENLLTKLQNINLQFHFEVEQQVNGAFLGFFGFNGTAGVWRISALEDSGGWMDRTTVEDMDIAVRAHLKGWKFVFLNDVEAQCELPESYEAYRKQQHRWHSGPMQLFRLCLPDIWESKIALWKKMNVVFLFFLLRKMILPFYSFTLFCILLPFTMFIPEAQLPLWVVCYIPGFMSILNVLPSPRYFPFMIPYLLFENTMSVTKFQAMVAGLFQLKSAHEWVVTKKTGRAVGEADAAPGAEGAPAAAPTLVHSASSPDVKLIADSPPSSKTVSGSSTTPQRWTESVAGEYSRGSGGGAFFPRTTSEPSLLGKPGRVGGYPRSSAPPTTPAAIPESEGEEMGTPAAAMAVDVTSLSALTAVSPQFPVLADRCASAPPLQEPKKPQAKKIYRNELALAILLLVAAGRSLLSVYGMHFYFLLFQGATFLVVGLDLITDRH